MSGGDEQTGVDGPLLRAGGVSVPVSAVRWQFARSSGPGGQNVNKVNTRAELWVSLAAVRGLDGDAAARLRQMAGHRLTAAGELHIACGEHRSQEMNRQEATARLLALLAQAAKRPKTRRKTKPTRGSKLRRLEGKKRRGETKRQRQGGEA